MILSFKSKIWLVISLIVLVFSLFSFLYLPAVQYKALHSGFEKEVQNIANTVALGVQIALSEQNFQGIQTSMDYAKADSRMRYLALLQYDTIWGESNHSYTLSKSIFKTFPDSLLLNMGQISSDTLLIKESSFKSEIMNGQVLVAFSTAEIQASIAQTKYLALSISFVLLILGSATGYWVAQNIARPILKLKNAAQKVGEGDLSFQLIVKTRDEIGQLSVAFNKMVSELGEAKDSIKEQHEMLVLQKNIIEEKNKNTVDSINYAKRIQDAMLTNLGNLKMENFVLYKPRDIVSGDFHWTFVKNNITYCAVADCTGHGVPGAFMSIIGSTVLANTINEAIYLDTNEILAIMHKRVAEILQKKTSENRDGIEIALCKIDTENNVIEYAGSRRPLIYIQDGKLFEIKGDKITIGDKTNSDDIYYTRHVIKNTDTGLKIYLFSDGYQDQFGGETTNGRKYMIKKLKKTLLEIHQKPMEEQKKILNDNLTNWMGEQRQIDDILMLGLNI